MFIIHTIEQFNNIVYSDICLSEIDNKFTPKKQDSLLLAESYKRIKKFNKADLVRSCGSWLEFIDRGEKVALHNANFCRDRLCPMCSWRRSYKIFGQVSQVMDLLGSNYRFLFLTLTVPNCSGDDLCSTIDNMLDGFRRLWKRKAFKAIKGFFRVLEITRNAKTGTYHPHFHIILAVDPSYFTSRDYIKRDAWLDMWRECMKDDSITQVDIRTVRNKHTGSVCGADLASAVAEVAKYAVKSADYILKNKPELMDQIVLVLSGALSGRRLIGLGGVFKDAWAQLGLDDCEEGDLIHIDDQIREDLATMILKYSWSAGCYKLVECRPLEIVEGHSVDPETGVVIV